MPNRFVQPVPYRPFRPDPVLSDGLAPVPRDDGTPDRRAARAFAQLADAADAAGGRGRQTTPTAAAELAGRDYWTRLQTALTEDAAAVYDRFGDDPDRLQGAFEALHTVHLADHVAPEIRMDYEAAFQRTTRPYLAQARADRTRRQQADDQTSFLAGLSSLQSEQARAVARLDPGTPGALDALIETQSTIDRSYDAAAERGVLAPEAAARGKAEARRATVAGFYGRQAEALPTPDAVAALRTQLQTDAMAGTLAGLDADGWPVLDGQLRRIEAAKRTQGTEAGAALTRRADDLVARAEAGQPVDPGARARLRLDAGTAPDGDRIVSAALVRLDVAERLRDTPLADAETALTAFSRQLTDDTRREALSYGQQAIRRVRSAASADPIGFAESRALIAPAPLLDLTADPDALSGAIAARVATGQAVARELGVRPRFLRAGEADGLAALAGQDPGAAADRLGALVAGAGPAARDVVAELGAASPALSGAGHMLAAGGSARAARDALLGSVPRDGRPLPAPGRTEQQAAARSVGLDDALTLLPDDAERITRTATAIARERMAAAGIDPAKDPDKAGPILTMALHEAAGARFEDGVQWGGFARVPDWSGWSSDDAAVLLPASIRADRFPAILSALQDADLAALPVAPVAPDGTRYRARDIRSARPVSVPGGLAFAAGDPGSDDPQWITAPDGRPFVLDPDQLADRLAARVPGAFRGAE